MCVVCVFSKIMSWDASGQALGFVLLWFLNKRGTKILTNWYILGPGVSTSFLTSLKLLPLSAPPGASLPQKVQ